MEKQFKKKNDSLIHELLNLQKIKHYMVHYLRSWFFAVE